MTREEARNRLLNYSRFIVEGTDLWEALDLAIEALEEPGIVRCGECKNYRATSDPELESYCYIDGRAEMTPDGYCSWGEKKQVTGKLNNPDDSLLTEKSEACKEQKSKLDCISRQQAVEAVTNTIREKFSLADWYEQLVETGLEIENLIKELPPVTPTERTGEWIESEIPNELYVCSECGGACWSYDYERNIVKSNYCPSCGCAMDNKGE